VYGSGMVFKMTPEGVLTTLHSFDRTDGATPQAGLVQATNGDFYGTTLNGGAHGYGTVFKMTPEGVLTTLHNFDFTDGAAPSAALVQATDGNFYSTTPRGGTSSKPNCRDGCGTVFKITPEGVLTTLHSFGGGYDGSGPVAGLVQATDGNVYGTAAGGGKYGLGTVFSQKIFPMVTFVRLR
jgi:uncharacterized repeat protein (TIGR03803 family)